MSPCMSTGRVLLLSLVICPRAFGPLTQRGGEWDLLKRRAILFRDPAGHALDSSWPHGTPPQSRDSRSLSPFSGRIDQALFGFGFQRSRGHLQQSGAKDGIRQPRGLASSGVANCAMPLGWMPDDFALPMFLRQLRSAAKT